MKKRYTIKYDFTKVKGNQFSAMKGACEVDTHFTPDQMREDEDFKQGLMQNVANSHNVSVFMLTITDIIKLPQTRPKPKGIRA